MIISYRIPLIKFCKRIISRKLYGDICHLIKLVSNEMRDAIILVFDGYTSIGFNVRYSEDEKLATTILTKTSSEWLSK